MSNKNTLKCNKIIIFLLSCLFMTHSIAATNAQTTVSGKLTIRNNHDVAYRGPVQFATKQPDGLYVDATGKFRLEVKNSLARGVVAVPARSTVDLLRVGPQKPTVTIAPLSVKPETGCLTFLWDNRPVAAMDFSLVVSNDKLTYESACTRMQPLALQFTPGDNGQLQAQAEVGPFSLTFVAEPYAEGFVDLAVTIERKTPSTGEKQLLLLRRMQTADVAHPYMCWNGRRLEGDVMPDHYEYDFRYTHDLDWFAWNAGEDRFFTVSAFTPYHVTQQKGVWQVFTSRHYFIPERLYRAGNTLTFISDIAYGIDSDKDKTTELPLYAGDPRTIRWRLAINPPDDNDWRTSQHYAYAGYRLAQEIDNATIYDLGAHRIQFGTSYFPYSTFVENFEYFRVKGVDREGWWPFSPAMWQEWEKFQPAMQRDLRILKALGFSILRPHYVGHLRTMDRDRAIAFLDWFFGEARQLGLTVLIDSEGDPEWMTLLVRRYGDIIHRFELENEILLRGFSSDDLARWQTQYQAIKAVKPDLPIHLTADGKMGVFERGRRLGLLTDAIGYHTYRHAYDKDPGWVESQIPVALSGASYASSRNMECLLTEFNWKGLTPLSPAARASAYRDIFTNILEPRAFAEFYQFQLQETLAPNPIIARSGIRHYEILHLDRRLKPEGDILLELIRRYAPADDAWQQLRIDPTPSAMMDTAGQAAFKLTNTTSAPLEVKLTPESYDGLTVQLAGSDHITLEPGGCVEVPVTLTLDNAAAPGVYHFFLCCDVGRKQVFGWGWTAKGGTPPFEPKPVLTTLVEYPQQPDIVEKFDYSRPTCIAFGSELVSMEMAYITFNTLRDATGYEFHLTNLDSIPDDIQNKGNLILVGLPTDNARIAALNLNIPADKGLIHLAEHPDGRQWLVLTGQTKEAVTAAAMDFVLRYWQNVRNASINKLGAEPGRGLGDQKDLGLLNPP